MVFGTFHKKPMVDQKFPIWVPVVFALVTPIFFASYNLLMKHMTTVRSKQGPGFNAYTLSFSNAIVSCVLIQIVAISWYWNSVEPINWKLFWFGFACSIFDNIGITFVNQAFSCGPVGPISAYLMLCMIMFVVSESIRLLRIPNWLQLIGLALGIFGGLILSIPK